MTLVRKINSHGIGLELWFPGAVICKSTIQSQLTARVGVLTSEPGHLYPYSKSSSTSPFNLVQKPKLMVSLKALCDLAPIPPQLKLYQLLHCSPPTLRPHHLCNRSHTFLSQHWLVCLVSLLLDIYCKRLIISPTFSLVNALSWGDPFTLLFFPSIHNPSYFVVPLLLLISRALIIL